jgi:hypothetical protein
MTILPDMVGHSRRHLGTPDPELGLHGPTAQRDINKETPL